MSKDNFKPDRNKRRNQTGQSVAEYSKSQANRMARATIREKRQHASGGSAHAAGSQKQYKKRYRLWPGLLLLLLVSFVLYMQMAPYVGTRSPHWLSFLNPAAAGDKLPDGSSNNLSSGSETSDDADTTSDQTNQSEQMPDDSVDESPLTTTTAEPTSIVTPVEIEIAAVGDLLMHRPITDGALVDDSVDPPVYDFNENFKYLAPLIQRANHAIVNIETTLAGPPYTGYPRFSAPDTVADALINAGFTLASTANNHILDRDEAGFFRTTQVLRDAGFEVIGTRLDESEPRDIILDIEGILVGITAYTFETPGTPQQKTLNSLPIPKSLEPLLNSFNPYRPEAYAEDLAAIKSHVTDMQARGAQLICLVMHWGEEYQTESRPYQREMAQALADAGVQIIFGHHPHVLQEIDVMTSQVTGEPTIVYYSLGNLLTNMTNEVPHAEGWSQDSLVARVKIRQDEAGVRIIEASYIPMHIIQVRQSGSRRHYVVPVLLALDDPSAFQTSASVMQAALTRIEHVMRQVPEDSVIPVVRARE